MDIIWVYMYMHICKIDKKVTTASFGISLSNDTLLGQNKSNIIKQKNLLQTGIELLVLQS